MPKSLKRTVYYYKVFTPANSESFDKKIRKVCSLGVADREFAHLEVTLNIDTQMILIEDTSVLTGIVHLSRNDAPSIRRVGTTTSEPIPLEDDQAIDEKTHFVFLPESGILAVEYNHHGPKVRLILKIVNELYAVKFDKDSQDSSFMYLSAGDGWRRIADSGGIKYVMFEYMNVTPQTMPEEAPYREAVKDLLSTGTPQTAQIILKAEKNSRDIIMSIKEFISKFRKGLNDGQFNKFKVKIEENETGGTETIDLIKDKLVKDFSVVPLAEGTKEINSAFLLESMAQDIADRTFA